MQLLSISEKTKQRFLKIATHSCVIVAKQQRRSGFAAYSVARSAQRRQTFPKMMRVHLPLKLGGVSPQLNGHVCVRGF